MLKCNQSPNIVGIALAEVDRTAIAEADVPTITHAALSRTPVARGGEIRELMTTINHAFIISIGKYSLRPSSKRIFIQVIHSRKLSLSR